MMEYDVFRENVILVNKLILSILNRNMMFLVFLHEKKRRKFVELRDPPRILTMFKAVKHTLLIVPEP